MPNLIVITVNNKPAFATLNREVAARVVTEMERGAVNPNHPIVVTEMEPHLETPESWLGEPKRIEHPEDMHQHRFNPYW